MARWSKTVAQAFLRWLPVSENKRWLDVGCGTGALSRLVLGTKQAKEVLAIDSSAIEVPTIFSSFEDYWRPFLSEVGPAPGYLVNLNESQQAALKERVELSLPKS